MIFYLLIYMLIVGNELDLANGAMTMKQIEQSMVMFRKMCIQKTNVDDALIDGMHRGEFPEVKELKCFTKCIAESAGTLNKKGDIDNAKVSKQIETLLPEHLREFARSALKECGNVQKKYKDTCDKSFYSTKCMYDFDPKKFLYP